MNTIGAENALVKMTESDINGVDKLRSFMVRSCCDLIHSWYAAGVTSFIHGTGVTMFIHGMELMRFGMWLV
jgi:hypothetical protein